MTEDRPAGLRIDRWLWYTRFFKTRSLATSAVAGGHVRINGERVKPGCRVVPGDRVELVRDRLPFELTVEAIPARRGPAAEARACYSESADAVARRERLAEGLRLDRMRMPRTDGRPDKRTRRRLTARRRRGHSD